MAISGKIRVNNPLSAKISTSNTSKVKTIMVSSTQRLTDLYDVDDTLIDDGAVIIYDAASSTFKINNEMSNPNTKIIGGSF